MSGTKYRSEKSNDEQGWEQKRKKGYVYEQKKNTEDNDDDDDASYSRRNALSRRFASGYHYIPPNGRTHGKTPGGSNFNSSTQSGVSEGYCVDRIWARGSISSSFLWIHFYLYLYVQGATWEQQRLYRPWRYRSQWRMTRITFYPSPLLVITFSLIDISSPLLLFHLTASHKMPSRITFHITPQKVPLSLCSWCSTPWPSYPLPPPTTHSSSTSWNLQRGSLYFHSHSRHHSYLSYIRYSPIHHSPPLPITNHRVSSSKLNLMYLSCVLGERTWMAGGRFLDSSSPP